MSGHAKLDLRETSHVVIIRFVCPKMFTSPSDILDTAFVYYRLKIGFLAISISLLLLD